MTEPRYANGPVTIYEGDCIEIMRELPDESVDAVVTDPPYGLEFMGREWDGADGFRRSLNAADVGRENVFGRTSQKAPEYRTRPVVLGQISDGDRSKGPLPTGGTHSRGYADHDAHTFQVWCELWAREALRVLKPGGHMLAFGGSRTWHRLAAGIEDAGFEIRDSLAWLYGSGFPKSLDVSKAIDKAAGAERYDVYAAKARVMDNEVYGKGLGVAKLESHPVTDAAREWEGWGTALKPAFEPIVVARKPLVGTVARNVLEYGTGALNIDATRIEHASDADLATSLAKNPGRNDSITSDVYGANRPQQSVNTAGRWPTNVILDESQAAALDEQTGVSRSRVGKPRGAASGEGWGMTATGAEYDDEGGASRFFYVAKADSSERPTAEGIQHPTVKPLELMQWLVRLVTPPNGVVLEPFAGSGTTVEACLREGFSCIAIEREPTYIPLILQRVEKPHEQALFG